MPLNNEGKGVILHRISGIRLIRKEKMKTRNQVRLFFLIGLILTLGLAACAPAAGTPEAGAPEEEAATSAPEEEATELSEEEGYQPAEGGEAGGTIVIDATDACSVVTEEQVAAAFGKDVLETDTDDQAMGTGCEYKFDTQSGGNQVQVSIYEGDAAKHYFAGLNDALATGCDAFFEKLFDINFLATPDSGQDVSGLSLGDLYTTYVGSLGECMFVQNQTRTDIGANVVTAETIYLNWSSNVAVTSDDRVVEFIYQEPIPDDVQAEFQTATDRDSMYAVAQPYRDSVLVNYTESLIGLLQQAAQ